MKFVLGLDIGIASVGWSLFNFEKKRIEDIGVRIFDRAEHPKTGESLAGPRRAFRLARRRLRRKRVRLRKVVTLFDKFGLISKMEWKQKNQNGDWVKNPYLLRAEGLDEKLNGPDLAKALYHLVKRRGFKSNKRGESKKNDDEGKLLAGIKGMSEKLAAGQWRTVGEMLHESDEFLDKKRNKSGSYEHTVARDALEFEVKELFREQRKFGSEFAPIEFEIEFLQWFKWQATPESGEKLLAKVGNCSLLKDEKRAALACFSYEKFVLLTKLTNLRWFDEKGEHRLTSENIAQIVVFALGKQEINYKQIREKIALGEKAKFQNVDYSGKKEKKKNHGLEESVEAEPVKAKKEKNPESETKFFKWRFFWDLNKAFTGTDTQDLKNILEDSQLLDAVGHSLSVYKTDGEIRDELSKLSLTDSVIEALLEEPQDGFGNLSLKAVRQLIPLMEQGLRYDEACEKLKWHHSVKKNKDVFLNKLPGINYDDIRNPVVVRALSQSRKVVNAIILKYGKPDAIHVEMARDLKRSFDERNEIKRENEKRAGEQERDFEKFQQEHGRKPRHGEILKIRLYREQKGRSAYQDTPLDIDRLGEDGYCEIDHILPYSRSFDDTYMNKVLVTTQENREKKNQIPFEYLGGESESKSWFEFKVRVETSHLPWKKKEKLLRQQLDQHATEEFRERNLSDTRYIARFFSEFIKENLGVKVVQPAGQLTAFLRKHWGLKKDRAESNLHHAQDATVIAAATQSMVQRAAKFSEWRELGGLESRFIIDKETGEVAKDLFPRPWVDFDLELKSRLTVKPNEYIEEIQKLPYEDDFKKSLKPIFPSFAPNGKVTGEAHPATIVSSKSIHENFSVKKVSLTELKLVEGEIELFDKEHNLQLHDALVKRLNAHGGDAKRAFKEVFHKPTRDGSPGPEVHKVKIVGKREPSLKDVRGGMTGNGEMVRVDVFSKKGKFWLVSIYVRDTTKSVLPNLAIIAAKPESEWEVMDEISKFMFSIQSNDLIEVVDKKNRYFGYYSSCHRGTGALKLKDPIDSSEKDPCVKTAKTVTKYVVDPLGEYHIVKQETRKPFEIKSKPRNSGKQNA